MTLFAFAQGAEHAAAEARAVADGNARAGPVFISGATGLYATRINGFYGVTEEKSLDGRLVLSKRGDPTTCIEHHGGEWQVKDVSKQGQAGARWRTAPRACGGFQTEKGLKTNRA